MFGVWSVRNRQGNILARAVYHTWHNSADCPCPGWLGALAQLHDHYHICWNPLQKPRFKSLEAKAKIRRNRLWSRLTKKQPLLAEELYNRALAQDPDYYSASRPTDITRQLFFQHQLDWYIEFCKEQGVSI